MENNMAIIIGCSKYKSSPSLGFVLNDTKTMQSAFITYCNCKKDDVITITSEDRDESTLITTTVINDRLTSLIEERHDQTYDNLYFYYSGHGIYSNGLLLLCEDWNPNFNYGMLSLEDSILKYLQSINSKYCFLFLDTCRTTTSIPESSHWGNKLPSNTVIFYSCSIGQSSRALSGSEISAYTFFLNKALEDNSVPCDVKGFNKALKKMIEDDESEFRNQSPNSIKLGDFNLEDVRIKYNGSFSGKENNSESHLSFSRNKCAYWVNTNAEITVPWIDDRYKVALIDYLLILDSETVIILIHSYGHDLLHVLNENTKAISATMRWGNDDPLDITNGQICFLDAPNLSVENAFHAVEHWISNHKKYQLIISIPSDNNPEVLFHAKTITNYISNNNASIHYEVLTLEDSYSISEHYTSLDLLQFCSVDENASCADLFTRIHQDIRFLSAIYSLWIKGNDLKKYHVLEIASNSLATINVIFSKMDFLELTTLLSSHDSIHFNINWDNIVFYIYCLLKEGRDDWRNLFEKIRDNCSDSLVDFIDGGNHIISNNIWSIYFHFMNKDSYISTSGDIKKGTPEYIRFVLGTDFNEGLRLEECIKDEAHRQEYRDLILRKDWNSIFLLPEYMR